MTTTEERTPLERVKEHLHSHIDQLRDELAEAEQMFETVSREIEARS